MCMCGSVSDNELSNELTFHRNSNGVCAEQIQYNNKHFAFIWLKNLNIDNNNDDKDFFQIINIPIGDSLINFSKIVIPSTEYTRKVIFICFLNYNKHLQFYFCGKIIYNK